MRPRPDNKRLYVYFILFTYIPIIIKCFMINPTISNSSGDWYIVSKSQQYSFISNYVECNIKEYCTIICDAINGCINITINGTQATNLEIKCSKDFSCKNMELIGAINTTNIYCHGHNSCSFGHIDLSNTNFISITCSSNLNSYACFKNIYYLPLDDAETFININCFGVACYYFGDIYIENDELLNTKFSINGCNQCHNLAQCIANYSIHCNHINITKTDLFFNGYCKSRHCGCDELYHLISNDDINENCPQYEEKENLNYPTMFKLVNNTNYTIINDSKQFDYRINIIIGVIAISIFIAFGILCCFTKSELTTSLYSKKKQKKQERMAQKQQIQEKGKKIKYKDRTISVSDDGNKQNGENKLCYHRVTTHSEINNNDDRTMLIAYHVSVDDIISNLISLRNGKFMKYQSVFVENLTEDIIQNIDKDKLRSIGIINDEDVSLIYNTIQNMTHKQQEQQINEPLDDLKCIENDIDVVFGDDMEDDNEENEMSILSHSNDENDRLHPSKQENTKMLLPRKIFPDNYDKRLHRKSKRRLLDKYNIEEIRKHNTSNSCWIIVDGLVLDVTKFLKYHPGEINAILKFGGTECDQHFAFHSPAGKQLFFKFVIGKINKENAQNCVIQ